MDPETASANHFPMFLMLDRALTISRLFFWGSSQHRTVDATVHPNRRSHENVSFLCGLYGPQADLVAVSRPHGSQGYSEIQSLLPPSLDAHVLGSATMSSSPHSQTHQVVVVGMAGTQNAWHLACGAKAHDAPGRAILGSLMQPPPCVVCRGATREPMACPDDICRSLSLSSSSGSVASQGCPTLLHCRLQGPACRARCQRPTRTTGKEKPNLYEHAHHLPRLLLRCTGQ